MSHLQAHLPEIAGRFEGYQGPNLSPRGLTLVAGYLPAHPAASVTGFAGLLAHLHRLSVKATYRILDHGEQASYPAAGE